MTIEASASKLLCRSACLVLVLTLVIAGSGIQLAFPTLVSAQTRTVSHGNFTPSSAVKRLDNNTWLIGVEALLPPPDPGSAVIVANRDFKLPPNGTITKLQGTFGFVAPFGNTGYTSCTMPNAALGIGKSIPFAVHVDSGGIAIVTCSSATMFRSSIQKEMHASTWKRTRWAAGPMWRSRR